LAGDRLFETQLRRLRFDHQGVEFGDALLKDTEPEFAWSVYFALVRRDSRYTPDSDARPAQEAQDPHLIDGGVVVLPRAVLARRPGEETGRFVVPDRGLRYAGLSCDLSDRHWHLPLDFKWTSSVTFSSVMQKLQFWALPTIVKFAVGFSYILVWMALEREVIEPLGINRYMPFYRVQGFCVWDFLVIATITIVLVRMNAAPRA
jgi:hypothetical protein